ncbi:hypothetical protein T07_4791 [Trichinella nelsoni]|uniref:Uncharacterized protein n=1 Tax=Trichinella nelsoni TaxID=6336 RepID=A0A0V0SEJ2_9BILA|nr:hypothetical protein T07_4791 [Trichinella nelsoni]
MLHIKYEVQDQELILGCTQQALCFKAQHICVGLHFEIKSAIIKGFQLTSDLDNCQRQAEAGRKIANRVDDDDDDDEEEEEEE